MSQTYRPDDHAERKEGIDASDAYMARSDADATIVAVQKNVLATPQAGWIAALLAYEACVTAAKTARLNAEAADTSFGRAVRCFSASVRDALGHAEPQEVAGLFGILPSKLVQCTRRDEVQYASTLLARLPGRTDLSYDASWADALSTCTAALQTATLADEDARRTLHGAGADLRAATAAFDTAYMKVIHAAKSLLSASEVASIFPRFQRRSKAKSTTATPDTGSSPASTS